MGWVVSRESINQHIKTPLFLYPPNKKSSWALTWVSVSPSSSPTDRAVCFCVSLFSDIREADIWTWTEREPGPTLE